MRRLALLVVAVGACQGSAADHEHLGDRAYLESRYGAALVEYRLALVQHAPSARLRAKAGAAALAGGELHAAVEEYRTLAVEDGQRRGEAVDGLQRVAERAIEDGERGALRAAVSALRELEAARALGQFGGRLAEALGERPDVGEALTLLPYAAALASDARRQDSLLMAYGDVLRRTGRCEAALAVFEGLVRRHRAPEAAGPAANGVALCGLQLGHAALSAGRPQDAQAWFARAAEHGGATTAGRAASLGLGDVAFALGDFAAAADAYLRVQRGAPPGDTLAARAAERLNRLTNAGTVFP